MVKPVNKIVIVGGGSSGWMAAAALIKAHPEKNITVIESPDYPIVGVGESTLGTINEYFDLLELTDDQVMAATNASYKLSIKFTDFYEKDAGSFHYPFGWPYCEGTDLGVNEWFFKKYLFPETPIQDYARCYFPAMPLIEQNKFSLNENNEFDNYDPKLGIAYHFDAIKLGQWLKTDYCLPRGVKLISDTVKKVEVNDVGVSGLILTNGEIVNADLYVDCTGFKSLLLGEALKEPFIDCSHILPNNRAWATRLPYKDKDKELEPFTHCTAIGNGWVWNIPVWDRAGTGYVYSDKFVSPEEAKEEFKQHLMSDKMVCPRTREEVDALEFKDIPMRVGYHERFFVKNVVAIGLSAAFIEPLESNGLFTVHEFLFKLLTTLERPAITQWDRDAHNFACGGIFKNFMQFVGLHYALSIRDDTEYWRANANRVYDEGLHKGKPTTAVGYYGFADKKYFSGQAGPHEGITWISTGMNYFINDRTKIGKHLARVADKDLEIFNMKNHLQMYEERKAKWLKAAEDKPSLYQWLKDNIYNGRD